jgi:flagellar hook assembly protein FlgD
VVILSHLSYASGNASSGMPIPSRDVAVQRVDNFANGFLSIGARAVWALGWQPGADIVDALHEDDATMDAVFMTHYRNGVNPLNGWIGWKPGYYDSERIPGAVVHIDPDPDYGFLRGVTGDLGFTTNEWRDASTRPTDVTPPVVNGVKAAQATVTIASAVAPVFTPNGDGISDSVAISFVLSEGAYVQVKVRRNGSGVRSWSTWAQKGAGTIKWDGRKDNGVIAAEGKYTVYITPTDRAGNKGEPGSAQVKILNSVHSPAANPALFWNRDGDALAPSAALKARLKREATVSWVIRDREGAVVRRGIDKELRGPGDVRFVWDGRDDDGASTPDGKYTARIVAKTANGTYAHDIAVRHMPYKAWTTRWTRKRGDRITLKVTSAEPLAGKPVVTANQPGIAKYTVPAKKVSRLSSTEFKVVIQTRNKGKAGDMKVRVKGTDKGGGVSSKVFTLRLK